MHLTYDKEANAAYLVITDAIEGVARSEEVSQNLVIDYDKDGRILGIEVLSASSLLHPDLLKTQ